MSTKDQLVEWFTTRTTARKKQGKLPRTRRTGPKRIENQKSKETIVSLPNTVLSILCRRIVCVKLAFRAGQEDFSPPALYSKQTRKERTIFELLVGLEKCCDFSCIRLSLAGPTPDSVSPWACALQRNPNTGLYLQLLLPVFSELPTDVAVAHNRSVHIATASLCAPTIVEGICDAHLDP